MYAKTMHTQQNNVFFSKKLCVCSTIAHPNSNFVLKFQYLIIMAKKKNTKKTEAQAKKTAFESLRFQVHHGLNPFSIEMGLPYHDFADAELEKILTMDITQDILDIKTLVESVKSDLGVTPMTDSGDFCNSMVALGLGFASFTGFDSMTPLFSWENVVGKKIVSVYYADEVRNDVVGWAKNNGYNTSTYLGKPIVKFNRLYIIIERGR